MDKISVYYFISFGWGLCILLSFIGWGSLLKEAVLPKKDIDWGQRAAWGVALSILVGGILNLFSAISRVTVISYIIIGILDFFLFSFPKRSNLSWREDKLAILGIFLVFLLLLLRYGAWVYIPDFHTDDFHGYLVFPQKMLQAGSLGADPFTERRLHGLGGNSFLLTLIFSFLKLQNLYIIDRGIAYIIAAGIFWGFAKEKKLSPVSALPIIAIFLFLVNPFDTNSSSHGMALALFLALFRIFDREEAITWKQRFVYVFLTALIVSALSASKEHFIGFAAIYLVIIYLARFINYRHRMTIIFEFFILIVFSFLLLLPWMISSYQSSGTMFYPILGKGFHRCAYGYFDFPPFNLKASLKVMYSYLRRSIVLFPLALSFLYLINPRKKDTIQGFSVCFSMVAVTLATYMLFYGALAIPRYIFPFFFSCLFFLIFTILSMQESLFRDKLFKAGSWAVIVLFIPFLLLDPFGRYVAPDLANVVPDYCHKIYAGMQQRGGNSKFYINKSEEYRKAQYSVPLGETILVRIRMPFLLDFKRNKIFIVDQLIMGLEPGMPVFKGGNAVGDYLISKGVRFVIYVYGGRENDDETRTFKKYMHTRDTWIKQEYTFMNKFQEDLDELGVLKKRIYDDGKIFVVDLRTNVLK